MNDDHLNRLNMARKVLAVLDKTGNKAVWNGKAPLVFTAKVGLLQGEVAAAVAAGSVQELATTGTTKDKAREEKELEDAAHVLGSALVLCCRDDGDETNAAPFDLRLSQWRALRDEQLLAKATALHAAALALTADPAKAPTALDYGITPAAVTSLKKEIDDYAALIAAPDTAIVSKKAVTASLRPLLAAVDARLRELDLLVPQFRRVTGGAAFESEYRAARQINDRGHGPGTGNGNGGSGTPPEAPTGFTLTPGAAGSKEITFSATLPATATALALFSQSALDPAPALVSTFPDGATQNTITFDSATSGEVYAFTLRAQNPAGLSPASGPVDGTIP